MDIYTAVETSIDGTWVSNEEYLLACPYCGDGSHNHLFLNVEKRVFYCHLCGEAGSMRQLLKLMEVALGEVAITKRPPPPIQKKRVARFDFWSLLPLAEHFREGRPAADKATKYLLERGVFSEEIDLYRLRYAVGGKYAGRIVFPVFDATGREVICWSARTFINDKPKYLYPHRDESKATAGECIFGLDWALHGYGRIVITEGVFDALAVNRNIPHDFCGVALLGKQLHEAQFDRLVLVPSCVVFYIMLDPDATTEALQIATRLVRLGREVHLANLATGDPASVDSRQLVQAILSAKLITTAQIAGPALSKRRGRE